MLAAPTWGQEAANSITVTLHVETYKDAKTGDMPPNLTEVDVVAQKLVGADSLGRVENWGRHVVGFAFAVTPREAVNPSDRYRVVVRQAGWFKVRSAAGILQQVDTQIGPRTFEARLNEDEPTWNWLSVGSLAGLASLGTGAAVAIRLRRRPHNDGHRFEAIETLAGMVTAWDPESRNLLPADLRIGQYLVVGKLGAGGMAAVYRATDNEGHFYALKIPNPDALAREDTRIRFEREISICATLIHPNIVRTFDYGTYESENHVSVPYLVMELVSGGELDEMLEVKMRSGATPDIAFALHIMEGLLSGLSFAHEKGIIHRDIKPSNLMMTPAGVKIMDFGIAHMVMMKTLTATGMVIGTPSHMAPEQVAGGGEDLDPRADIYAAGVILYQLLTHKLPYPQQSNDPMGILLRKLEGPPPPPIGLNPQISPHLNDLVLEMLAVDRNTRCPSAENALSRLRTK